MADEFVILVDEDDKPRGTMEKMKAHVAGELHRAFSVFIFNTKGELLLQRRASHKYHSPKLWTNTVCSHPRKGETTEKAAHRRIVEEMGFDCDFNEVFSFVYNSDVGQGLIEHEYDHVFIGISDIKPVPNPEEVGEWKYVDIEKLKKNILDDPQNYTVWFRIAFDEVLKNYERLGIR